MSAYTLGYGKHENWSDVHTIVEFDRLLFWLIVNLIADDCAHVILEKYKKGKYRFMYKLLRLMEKVKYKSLVYFFLHISVSHYTRLSYIGYPMHINFMINANIVLHIKIQAILIHI